MNDWKRAPPGGGAGGKRPFSGPGGSVDKVDYSRLPVGGGSDDEEDWIQRQIRGHKVSGMTSLLNVDPMDGSVRDAPLSLRSREFVNAPNRAPQAIPHGIAVQHCEYSR